MNTKIAQFAALTIREADGTAHKPTQQEIEMAREHLAQDPNADVIRLTIAVYGEPEFDTARV